MGLGVSDFITKMLKPSTKHPSAMDILMVRTTSVSMWSSLCTCYRFDLFIVLTPSKLERLL
jgi:hypothetical protein